MWPGHSDCLELASGLERMRKRTASVGPPKNLEKILSSKYGRYKDQGQQANHWVTGLVWGRRSLAFLNPVPTVFILFPVLLCFNNFFVPSAKETQLQGRERRRWLEVSHWAHAHMLGRLAKLNLAIVFIPKLFVPRKVLLVKCFPDMCWDKFMSYWGSHRGIWEERRLQGQIDLGNTALFLSWRDWSCREQNSLMSPQGAKEPKNLMSVAFVE